MFSHHARPFQLHGGLAESAVGPDARPSAPERPLHDVALKIEELFVEFDLPGVGDPGRRVGDPLGLDEILVVHFDSFLHKYVLCTNGSPCFSAYFLAVFPTLLSPVRRLISVTFALLDMYIS